MLPINDMLPYGSVELRLGLYKPICIPYGSCCSTIPLDDLQCVDCYIEAAESFIFALHE